MVIGSANFPENEVLAEVYALALQAKGVKVTTKLNIGAREVYYPQVEKGTISIIPEYNGTLLSVEVDKTSTAKTTAEVDAALAAKLPSTLTVLNPAAGPGQRLGDGHPGDRGQVPPQVDRRPQALRVAAGDRRPARVQDPRRRPGRPEVHLRPDVQELRPARRVGPDHPGRAARRQGRRPRTCSPPRRRSSPTSWSRSTDPKFNFAAQNVIPLVYKPALTSTISTTLNAVSAKLTTSALLALDVKVITDKENYTTAAQDWLQSVGLS